MDKITVANLLKDHRNLSKLSIAEVIQKLKQKGISISEKTLYGYENGVSFPNVPTFIALCDIYDIDDVFGDSPKNSLRLSDASASFDEWHIDQYNDFFNSGLFEKLYLLRKWGIPSFSGYEKQLNDSFPKDADAANMSKLWSFFSMLDETTQGNVIAHVENLASNPACLKDEYKKQNPAASEHAAG